MASRFVKEGALSLEETTALEAAEQAERDRFREEGRERKTLQEQIKEHKEERNEVKQAEFAKRNVSHKLDEAEVRFYEQLRTQALALDSAVKQEEAAQVAAFRLARARAARGKTPLVETPGRVQKAESVKKVASVRKLVAESKHRLVKVSTKEVPKETLGKGGVVEGYTSSEEEGE